MNCPITNKPCSKNRPYHITEVIDNKTVSFDLCADCLRSYVIGDNIISSLYKKSMGDVEEDFMKDISELFKFMIDGEPEPVKKLSHEKKCPGCGYTLEDIMTQERAGCPKCYECFRDEMQVFLQQIHGSKKHVGKVPKKWKSKKDKERNKIPTKVRIKNLLLQMQTFIQDEEYEKAIPLRDAIDTMKDIHKKLETLKRELEKAILNEESDKVDVIKLEMFKTLQDFNEIETPFLS